MKKIIFLLILLVFPFYVSAKDNVALAENAKSAILIEQSTGKVIYEKNSLEKMAPASMTKMMSLLLIMEQLDSGKIKLSDKVTVSKNASSMGGSQILLEQGEQMSVEDLLKGIAIASGNDAVGAMAEFVATTEENFVKMMNSKAKKLGLNNTNFKNCHGLDEEGHYSCAHDMAIIAKELLNHKKILDYTSIYETYLRENTDRKIWLVNTNKLVRFKKGVDGLKTGYTKTAGYCLTATMKKDNMRLIGTVMGEDKIDNRNSEMSDMLDYGYNAYKMKKIYSKNKVIKNLTSDKIKQKSIKIVPSKDVYVLLKKSENIKPSYTYKINNLKTDMKKKDKIGVMTVKNNGKVISKVNLTVIEDVKKANIIELYFKYLKDITNGNMSL